jgi:hypothetical protein
MATPDPICCVCSRPIVLGAHTILHHRERAHLTCQEEFARPVNSWPDGSRHLVCLNCGRAFESDSKAQRLCQTCRAGKRQ